jgi:hypothetical protein
LSVRGICRRLEVLGGAKPLFVETVRTGVRGVVPGTVMGRPADPAAADNTSRQG